MERALAEPNPAKAMGVMGASLPPATMAWASPLAMSSEAIPIASAPLEQEEVVQKLGPLAPRSMDTCPAAISEIIMGTRKGLTREGPLWESTWNC